MAAPFKSACSLLALVSLGPSLVFGGSFRASFDDGKVPDSCRVFGSARVEGNGGVGGSGVLKLTKAVNDQTGSFLLGELDSGAKVFGFQVSMQVRVGGGTALPADGWSLSFAPDLPGTAWGEEGAGTGLSVVFDTYDNGRGEAPSIKIKVGGRTVAFRRLDTQDLDTGVSFVPVRIDLAPGGGLSVRYGVTGLFADIPYPPSGGIGRARFGLGARTGGLTANQFIDDLSIETILTPSGGGLQPSRDPSSVTLGPYSCCDGQVDLVTVGEQNMWQTRAGSDYMYFHLPPTFQWTPGAPVYVQVTYLDTGYGTVGLQYDSSRGNDLADFYWPSETHTRSSRVNSGQLAQSYHQLALPKLAARENGGTDFRLCLEGGGGVPLSVERVLIQTKPFEDPAFSYVLTKPWLAPYSGPTKSYVDPSSLRHKVMVGYQGWFRAPNDLSDLGWRHWCRNNQMAATNFSVDLWPDVTSYASNELFRAGEIVTRSGAAAYLFSSTTRETVRRHFQWMRQNNIDGAFLQRFVHPSSSGAWGNDEWVLQHVREAANEEGRIWAIEYDVSSLNPSGNSGIDPLAVIQQDWKWLVDVVGILKDPQYAHEQGKPVLFIWGLPFPDRGFSRTIADQIIDFLHDDPQYGTNYLIGGIPWWWRTMSDWLDHVRRYNGVLTWIPPSSGDFAADFQMLRAWGIDYFPHAWPGFSWANLQREPAATSFYAPRNGGQFFWDRVKEALGPGSERLFIGMFDEYDEGTAIMPMSDDPPQAPPAWGRFVTNEGRSRDWWMVLAGEAKEVLLRYRPLYSPLPTDAEVASRGQIGPEALLDLGATNQESLLHLIEAAGSRTAPATIAGKDCRSNLSGGGDRFLAFDVDSAFAEQVAAGLAVTIDLEYLDQGNQTQFTLQYDAVGEPNRTHRKSVATQGTGEWRTVRYNIADAFFGNRQGNGPDFRVQITGGGPLYVNRVWLAKSWSVMPVIEVQPQDLSMTEGDSASLNVLAHGTSAVNYQWWFGSTALQTTTSTNLDLNQVSPNQAGSYYAVVFTATGSTTSRVATVTVQALPKLVWATPLDIVYGTPLSAVQLNAQATVPGNFDYTPPLGTVLNAGTGQVLTVRFKPAGSGAVDSINRLVLLNVRPAPLTITALDATRAFGAPNPILPVTYSGWVNGDTVLSLNSPPILETLAAPDSPPGAYPVTVRGASAPNYAIQFVPGILTITLAQQSISFQPLNSKTFRDPPFTLGAVSSSGLPVNYAVVSGPARITGDQVTLTGAGSVTIQASQPGNANYLGAPSLTQTFDVAKASQTITFDPIASKALGLPPFALTAVASSGLPVAFSVLTGPAAVVENTVSVQGLGEVTIRASQPGDNDFLAAPDVEQQFSVFNPIRSPRLLPSGEFAFTFTGEQGTSYTLEGSYDLVSWTRLITLLNTNGVLEFSDATQREFQWRFYRVVLQTGLPPAAP